MSYLYTGSQQTSKIQAGLSTQIIIEVNNKPVGAIQTLTATQTRPLGEITEIGTDGIIEIVPNGATKTNINVTRVVFEGRRLAAALGRAFFNIQSQRFPFDIKVFDNSNAVASNTEGDPSSTGQVCHIYKNCWFANINTSYNSGNYIISETAAIQCENVRTFTGNDESAIPLSEFTKEILEFGTNANIERTVDSKGRRGSLDAAGLARIVG